MRTPKKHFTAEELFCLSATDQRYELVKGDLYEMAPAGGRHGSVARRIAQRLGIYADSLQLGEVFAAETGFILRREPDTVRAPDASFVAAGRLPEGELPTSYIELAPDLAVEVVSPSERTPEVRDKVADWLLAGTRLVWVIYPATRSVTVYRSLEDFENLSEEGSLDGGQVVPGFSCQIRDLFS